MKRRDFFRAFAMAGTVMASAKSMRAQTKLEGGPSGKWPNWPFEEIRIPYRERAGKIHWPNNGPLCVHVYLTGEWSWRTAETVRGPDGLYKRDVSRESMTEQYGFTVGIWRGVRLLDKFGIKATIFPHAGMVERYPDLFRELHGKGHEIVARSYDGISTMESTEAEERREIQKCTAAVEKVIGQRPVGWINPGARCTDKTAEILADAGYLWHGDLKGDDLPYGIKTRNGKKIVVIPHRTITSNDNAVYQHQRSVNEAFQFMKESFDAFYMLGQEEYPLAMTYGIHPDNSLIPDRVAVHERVFDYMLKFKDVWWARYVDMAEHWMKNYMNV